MKIRGLTKDNDAVLEKLSTGTLQMRPKCKLREQIVLIDNYMKT